MEPYFELNGNKVIASRHTAGPWDPNMQHGGAPTALIASIVDQIPSQTPMQLARLTVDLKRPVPVGHLEYNVEITREGRNIQTAEITLIANGKEVVKAFALKMRVTDQNLPAEVMKDRPAPTRTAQDREFFRDGVNFGKGMTLRKPERVPDGMHEAVWFHIGRPFFPDRETTPLMRAAATGDFCNAFGAQLDFDKWTYINADLTLHFTRAPVGEWIMLAANGWMGGNGRGHAFGELADERGFFGRSVQSLVIGER